MPLPDDEPTPLEPPSPRNGEPEFPNDDDEVDEDDVEEEDGAVALDPLAVPALCADAPGIVAALTAAKTPTPAAAASATPVVIRLSRCMALSRASMRRCVSCMVPFIVRKLERRR